MTHPQDVILGILAVMLGCLSAAWSFWVARFNKNPLAWVPGIGAVIFVIGVVGQQVPQVDNNVWSTTDTVPVVGVSINTVTVIGLLAGLLGLSLVMFFERVIPDEQRWQPPTRRPFADDDTI